MLFVQGRKEAMPEKLSEDVQFEDMWRRRLVLRPSSVLQEPGWVWLARRGEDVPPRRRPKSLRCDIALVEAGIIGFANTRSLAGVQTLLQMGEFHHYFFFLLPSGVIHDSLASS